MILALINPFSGRSVYSDRVRAREEPWRCSMNGTVVSLLVGVALCAAPAVAGAKTINGIEHREQLRIRQGIRSGELTRAEARRLEAEQARIRVDERFARADGRLTPKERERLHKEL